MIKAKSICIAIILSLNIQAQDYFFEFVDGWVNNFCYELNGEYVYMGLETNSINPGLGNHQYKYNLMNGSGELVSQVEFLIDSTATTTTRIEPQVADWLNQDELLICGTIKYEDPDNSIGTLIKYHVLNQEFELLDTFNLFPYNQFYCLDITDDNKFVIAGHYTDGIITPSLLLFQTDSDGNIDWQFNESCGSFCSLRPEQVHYKETDNTTYILAEQFDANQPAFSERLSAVLIKTDDQGQEIWRVYPGDHENFWIDPGGIIELDDGILVFYGTPRFYESNNQASTNLNSSIFYSKYDFDGNLIFEGSLEEDIPNIEGEDFPGVFHHLTQTQQLDDGSILLSGQINFQAFLIKINADFELQWMRKIAPYTLEENETISQFTIFYNVTTTSDGGFMAAGQYDSAPSDLFPQAIQTAIAVKVDEFGCLEPGCQLNDPSSVIELEILPLKVFPNPANDKLIIDLNGINLSDFQLFDIHGKRVSAELQKIEDTAVVDINILANGVYLLQVIDDQGQLFQSKMIKN